MIAKRWYLLGLVGSVALIAIAYFYFQLHKGLDPCPLCRFQRACLVGVAFFCLFDAIFLVFLGALEGAGDTRFIMKMSFLISILLLVLPCYLYIKYFDAKLYVLWWIITINVIIYCSVFYWRFQRGPWREMRVI